MSSLDTLDDVLVQLKRDNPHGDWRFGPMCDDTCAHAPTRGKLTALMGAMSGGKTSRLIEEVARCKERGMKYLIVKSGTDTRIIDPTSGILTASIPPTDVADTYWDCARTEIRTHSGVSAQCLAVESLYQLPFNLKALTNVLFVDEAHFLNDGFRECVTHFLHMGVSVMVACLRTDFRAQPFPPSAWLMHHANVQMFHPDCHMCNGEKMGFYTQRISSSTETISCGGLDDYRPLCTRCYSELCPQFFADAMCGSDSS